MTRKSIQVRLDDRLKREAERVFAKIGLDTPTAIRIFFTKVVATGGIPFTLRSHEPEFTAEEIAEFDRLAAEAKQGKNVSKAFSSAEEMIEDLHSRL